MSITRRGALAVLGAGLATALAACGGGSAGSTATAPSAAPSSAAASSSAAAASPKVVAATSWEGGLAKAAGATDITVIAPASLMHAPDYDPKPADLAAVADADYVLYADFEGFAGKLKEATGSKAELISMKLENTPGAIRSEVMRLAEKFGTMPAADAWMATFDTEYAKLSGDLKKMTAANPPTVVSQAFMGYWAADFAGLKVAGAYGPQQITPAELAKLTAAKPTLVIANAHMPGDPEISGATKITLINYPGEDLDMLTVFRTNADLLMKATMQS